MRAHDARIREKAPLGNAFVIAPEENVIRGARKRRPIETAGPTWPGRPEDQRNLAAVLIEDPPQRGFYTCAGRSGDEVFRRRPSICLRECVTHARAAGVPLRARKEIE